MIFFFRRSFSAQLHFFEGTKSESSINVEGSHPVSSKIPSPSQLRRPLLIPPRSPEGEISYEPDDAPPGPTAMSSGFTEHHEPSLEKPSLDNGASKRRLARSASHSNHDVKWPAQEDNAIKEALQDWGKRVKEG